MKRSLDEHASRFDEKATEYDTGGSQEYRAALSLVLDHADPAPDDVVLDLGTGTGAIALALAPEAGRVIGRDISEGMLSKAREKATTRGLDSVSFGEGRFREPRVGDPIDVVTSNFAMHHLDDEAKREAIGAIADLEPHRFVLGDVMCFDEPDPTEPFYDPEVDDPSTVGHLVDAMTGAGFVVTAVERIHDQVGVVACERREDSQ